MDEKEKPVSLRFCSMAKVWKFGKGNGTHREQSLHFAFGQEVQLVPLKLIVVFRAELEDLVEAGVMVGGVGQVSGVWNVLAFGGEDEL